jgi:hypothetical protein
MGSFIICTHHQILLGRSNQGNEVGRACGTNGRGEENVQGFRGKAQRKKFICKTKAYIGGWDENGPWGDWLGGCGVDSPGSG